MNKMNARTVDESRVETVHLILPSHTNAIGTIFGGTLMSWIDIAAAICAYKHSRRVCVTASIDALHFKAPARLGDAVFLKAEVVHTGKTSMFISVTVDAENTIKDTRVRCVDAWLTFVALDEKGNPTPVCPLKLRNDAEKKAFRAAAARRELLISRFKTE